MKREILLLGFFAHITLFSLAQNKRLYIGDQVPLESIVFTNVRNYPGGKAKLSDFKGKYIILDFWTKYCSSCIAAFPKMQRLQEQFKKDIQILLVTKNEETELRQLFLKSPVIKSTTLPMVLGDSILAKKLFPHGTVPYHVWLDREGKVLATTYGAETNTATLQELISGKMPNLLIRNEIFDQELIRQIKDDKISFLEIGNGSLRKYLRYYAQVPGRKNSNIVLDFLPDDNYQIGGPQDLSLPYYSLFITYVPGDFNSTPKMFRDDNKRVKGFRIFNQSVLEFYLDAYLNKRSDVEKIIVEGKARELYEDVTDTTNMKRRLINNSYCYESSLPTYDLEAAKKLLQQDLARFFGMTASIEERPLRCLVLTRLRTADEKKLWATDQTVNPETKDVRRTDSGYLFKDASLGYINSRLSSANRSNDDPVIIDETNFTEYEKKQKIDVFIKCNNLKGTNENLPLIQRELARYGLGLEEEVRRFKVLVLKSVL